MRASGSLILPISRAAQHVGNSKINWTAERDSELSKSHKHFTLTVFVLVSIHCLGTNPDHCLQSEFLRLEVMGENKQDWGRKSQRDHSWLLNSPALGSLPQSPGEVVSWLWVARSPGYISSRACHLSSDHFCFVLFEILVYLITCLTLLPSQSC